MGYIGKMGKIGGKMEIKTGVSSRARIFIIIGIISIMIGAKIDTIYFYFGFSSPEFLAFNHTVLLCYPNN